MTKLVRYTLYVFLLFIAIPDRSKAGTLPDLRKWGPEWEEYDSTLFYRLQSINDIISYADSLQGPGKRQTRAYSEVLASTVCKRFYHGYSYYSVEDNWIAWLAGKVIWDHLHAIVLPKDILNYPNAACSQQAIVLKECFKVIGVDYREVNLYGHFVIEGKVEGQWLLFDTNMEPRFPNGRRSLEDLMRSDDLAHAYQHVLDPDRLDKMFAHPVYCPINAPMAPNATLFHQVTGFLSFSLPLMLPLVILIFLVVKIGAKKNKEPKVRFVDVEEVEKVEILCKLPSF